MKKDCQSIYTAVFLNLKLFSLILGLSSLNAIAWQAENSSKVPVRNYKLKDDMCCGKVIDYNMDFIEKDKNHPTENKLWSPKYCMNSVKFLSNTSLSSDCSVAFYTIDEPIYKDKKSQFIKRLVKVDLSSKTKTYLTNPAYSCLDPKLSPNDDMIAFLSDRNGKMNIWLLPVNGGEAWLLTDVPTKVTSYEWSPDGKTIALTVPSEAKDKIEEASIEGSEIEIQQLYIVPVPSSMSEVQKCLQLTKDNFYVRSDTHYDWSPDSKKIAFSYMAGGQFDDWPSSTVAVIDTDTLEIQRLENDGATHSPYFSPDGSQLAYVKHEVPYRYDFTANLELCSLKDSTRRTIDLSSIDQEFGLTGKLIGWGKDNQTIYLQQAQGTELALFSVDCHLGKIKKVDLGLPYLSDARVQFNRTIMTCVLQSCDTPPEVYAIDFTHLKSRKVSNEHDDLSGLAIPKTERIQWLGDDDVSIQGLLTYPNNYQKGNKYPLIVIVHGGPMASFLEDFIAAPKRLFWPVASFAQEGYLVLRCNIRGSTGYGKEFRKSNFCDWGGKDFKDLMCGVDHLIAKGIVDSERLGISGWSYGGFMTTWTISHTDRFKAASIGAPVINLVSFTGTADTQRFIPNYFKEEFWQNLDLYIKHSPITHAHRIKTPVLLQHGLEDKRVPVQQSYELHHVLKKNNIRVEFVKYPRTPHGIIEPELLIDCANRNLGWFNQLLKP
ncbi:MAG: putative secreted peptidase [Chlamydiales bacterium]|jgi:dipeptidyl aminopeptidase/acylaminoacyl peptidase|nr:putative secreted peptidase [Chlamydiales bacterium]